MTDENIRLKALELLKQSSSAFVESYKRDGDEKNAVARSKIYLEEYSNLLTSKGYQERVKKSNQIRPTKLVASDIFPKRPCAGDIDPSCKFKQVTDDDVKNFVNPLNKNNNITEIDEQNIDFNVNSLETPDLLADEGNNSFSDPTMNAGIANKSVKIDVGDCSKKHNSDDDKHTQSSAQITSKKTFKNPFKKAKIDEFFTQNPKESVSLKKENKANNENTHESLKKEYELQMYKSYIEGLELKKNKLAAAKSKLSNPWKTDKVNNPKIESPKVTHNTANNNKFDNKQKESPFAKFDMAKSSKENFHNNLHKSIKDEDIKMEKKNEPQPINNPLSAFRTGTQELEWQNKLQKRPPQRGLTKKRSATSVDDPPLTNNDIDALKKKFHCPSFPKAESNSNNKMKADTDDDNQCEELKGFDEALLKRIQREIVVESRDVSWDDIIGLEEAKKVIKESVILAIKRPDLFTGLRQTTRAIMLFGAPGNGKTLIGKCIASSCDATFMSVSSSTLTSKWIGDSELLVRAMFTYAKIKQPCVIFFDEIDSLLEKRSEQGNETFNRIKTEFLVQLDGANALKETDRVLLIGATNRPDVIDEAILRRFTKRILVPLPVKQARINMFTHLLSKHRHTLSDKQIDKLAEYCENYSGSDISQICKEAAMMSLRGMESSLLESMKVDDIPPISPRDFLKALKNVKPTVSQETIAKLEEWNSKYGSTVDTNRTIDIDDVANFFDDDDDGDLDDL